ncbi:diguanylate cyclase, partial [Streptomyces sp. G35A]
MSDQPRRPRKPAKPYRRPKKDPVRVLAFDALRAVDERDAYANLVLPPLLRAAREKGDFDARDAALATELVYGTLRGQGTYDAIIAACVDRPLREVDPPVLDVLSLGAHQLLGTRIPTHAAVSASVELARVVLGDGRAKFVNAVLRKIAQDDLDGWLERVAPPYDDDPEDHLAVVHSHPRWVVSALWDSLGGGRAGIEDLLRADNERPEVTLVARPGRSTTGELLHEEAAVPGRWSPHAVRLTEGGEPGAITAVAEGRAGVQDEGSQLVALALVLLLVMMRDTAAEMAARSETDALSGILNRRGFDLHAERLLAKAERADEPLTLVTADIDHFKRINDEFGHAAGDATIAHVAALLRESVRGDALVSRLGGEEFAVLLAGANLADGRRYAERVRERLAAEPPAHLGAG